MFGLSKPSQPSPIIPPKVEDKPPSHNSVDHDDTPLERVMGFGRLAAEAAAHAADQSVEKDKPSS